MLTADTQTSWVGTGLYDRSLSLVFDVYWRAIGQAYARRRTAYRVKRASDVILAIALLVATVPLLLLVAAAIKLTGKGPILYRQRRLMRGGWSFTLLKFRTMVVGADGSVGRAYDDPATGPLFKRSLDTHDPRVTLVGRILRASFLDELPQLINVLRGEMSFVGPRPCQPQEAEGVPREFMVRFAVPQGLTGPWQIQRHRHRHDPTFARQLEVEADYVEHWSLANDLWILIRTIPVVLSRAGV